MDRLLRTAHVSFAPPSAPHATRAAPGEPHLFIDTWLVETDSYDRDARAKALVGPAVEALCEKGARVTPHFRALLEDLFAVCFKLRLRVRDEGPRSLALNRRLLGAVLAADGIDELRASCALDPARSAAGAMRIARAALAEIRKGEALTDEELLDQQALAQAEGRLGELDDLAQAIADEPNADAMRARIEREKQRQQERVDELAERVDRAMEDLPFLERRVAQATAQAAEGVEEDEEEARAFAEKVGLPGSASAAERLELAEKLRGNEKLRKLANLAGAFRRDALAARRKRVFRASSEMHKVGRGADLARLLPAELGAFVDRRRRLDFLRRLAERDLAEYELVGSDRGGRGPMVICVDASGSMAGPRELWAKAVSLALLEVARRQNRRVEAIVFAGREAKLARFPLLDGKRPNRGGRRFADTASLLEFADCFPGGGTDFEKPLSAAMELLEDARLKGGDIVFVTDGEAPIRESFADEVRDLQRRLDFAIYGVLIDDPSVAARRPAPGAVRPEIERAARELRKVTDRITTVTRLTSGAVKDLFERI